MSAPARTVSAAAPAPRAVLQCRCACGTHAGGGACRACATAKEREAPLLRHASPAPGAAADRGVTPVVERALASPGQPLRGPVRAAFEPLFRADFSRVRVHTGSAAAESARALAADAYTVGQDVVFASGRFEPETIAGRGLLAHELAHVVQQRRGLAARQARGPAGDAHEREAEAAAERAVAPRPAQTWIVDDDTSLAAPGQMRKSVFLARLRPALCRAADAELARVGQDTRGCPYLERAFEHYAAQPATRLEAVLRRFAPESARAASAEELIPAVAARVAAGVARWAATGELPELPDGVELGALAPGGLLGRLGALAGPFSGLVGGLSRLFFKTQPGAPAARGGAVALPAGAPLDAGVRDGMSRALGHALPDVRVHTGAEAASLNARLGSRAFTLGRHIAFGHGEYQPGTPVGDALLAHELAHVVQQGTPVEAATLAQAAAPSPVDGRLESDADDAAAGAVVSLWSRARHGLRELRRTTGPRLRAGLRLQMGSCGGSRATAGRTTTPAAPTRAACAATDAAAWSASVLAARAQTDLGAQASAMSALVAEALCPLGLTVHTAGTAHTDTEHPDDYEPQPTVNFDVRLNSKTIWSNSERGGQLLTGRAGHNFTARGRAYAVLGPLALDDANSLFTRQTAQHELFMVTHTFPAGATRDEIELETWTEDFRAYFHQYMTITPRPRWTPLARYYDGSGGPAQRRAVARLVDYYNNPPVSPAERATFQRAFVNWMRRNPSALVTDLDAQLHLLRASGGTSGGTP